MKPEFTPLIRRRSDVYVACIAELPGVTAQGATRREAQQNLAQALARVSAANLDFAARSRERSARRTRKRRR